MLDIVYNSPFGQRVKQMLTQAPGPIESRLPNNALGAVVRAAPPLKGLQAVGGAMDLSNYISTILGGSALELTSMATINNRPLPFVPQELRDITQQAQQDNANPFAGLRQINQEYAGQHPYQTGLLDMVLDPLNLAGEIKAVESIPKLPTVAKAGMGFVRNAPENLKAAQALTKQMTLEGLRQQEISRTGLAPKLDEFGNIQYKDLKKGIEGPPTPIMENVRTRLNPRTFLSHWRTQAVMTLRQLWQEPSSVTVWAKNNDISVENLGQAFRSMAKSMESQPTKAATFMTPPQLDLAKDAMGIQGNPLEYLGHGAFERTASGIGQVTARKVLSPGASSVAGILESLAQPLRPSVPILGTAAKAGGEYFRGFQNGFISTFLHNTQMSARSVAFSQEYSKTLTPIAEDFLTRLGQQYPNAERDLRIVANNKFQAAMANPTVDGDMQALMQDFNPDHYFNQQDVKRVLQGYKIQPQAMTEWQNNIDTATENGSKYAKKVFGDFGEKGPIETKIDMAVPFLSWYWRAIPRTASIAINHPLGTYALMRGYQEAANIAQQQGLPSYMAGTIPIPTSTPVLGGVLKNAFLGGRQGQVRLDPLQGISPVGGETAISGLGGDSQSSQGGAIQHVLDLMQTLGMSPTPPLGLAAYGANQTWRTPGALSRQSGIEQALPGPEIPSILHGTLQALHEKAGGGPTYDPVQRMGQELVYMRTGKPISDPSNKKYAMELSKKTGIYNEAEFMYNQMGAARNIASNVSPFTVQTVTNENLAQRKAQAEQPLSKENIQQLGDINANLAVQGQGINNQYAQGHPIVNLYKAATLTAADKVDPRLAQWQQQNLALKRTSPTIYNQREKQVKKALGL